MKEEAEKQGLFFLCTPFGLKSAGELRALAPGAVKIASPELNHTALLKAVASYGTPVFLSSGVALLGDIEAALGFFPREAVCLLHCVTAYPAPPEEYNLRLHLSLGGIFGAAVGVSDHSMDPELVPGLATALGARAVEKHFCLSRSGGGLDDPIALTPEDFGHMTGRIREISALRRRIPLAGSLGEDPVLEDLRVLWGRERVDAVLGSGVKVLAPSERANYETTRRSVHALRDIEAGETIAGDSIAVLRSEKRLKPGLSPAFESLITGRKARRFIPDGQGIGWEDI
jgi:sialic acid synthase SpsE